jgi:sulfur carrier protein
MTAANVVSIQVQVNGETRMLVAGATVAHLLADLGLQGKQVAVERNQEVVPRAEHGTTKLADGDRLEVVTFVGGG